MSNQELATTGTEEKIMIFTPMGEKDSIKLSPSIVQKLLVNPTKSGARPTDKDVMGFMMLCKARELNPFTGDAFLIGYDSQDGPNFSLVTAKVAYDKRAERNEHFDGMESGLVILKEDTIIERREGAILLQGETVIGAWAIVYRKDRERPTKHDVNLASYDKKRSHWNTDKPGMIVKVAEAGALRKAFPNTFAGMYIAEESEATHHAEVQAEIVSTTVDEPKAKTLPAGFQRAATESEKKALEEPPAQTTEPKATTKRAAPKKEVVAETAPDPKPEKPAEKPAADPTPSTDLSPEHIALKAEAKKHGVLGAQLCAVAGIFFGQAYETFAEIPPERCAAMLESFDDVLGHITPAE